MHVNDQISRRLCCSAQGQNRLCSAAHIREAIYDVVCVFFSQLKATLLLSLSLCAWYLLLKGICKLA